MKHGSGRVMMCGCFSSADTETGQHQQEDGLNYIRRKPVKGGKWLTSQ